jgi:hypothetical protein
MDIATYIVQLAEHNQMEIAKQSWVTFIYELELEDYQIEDKNERSIVKFFTVDVAHLKNNVLLRMNGVTKKFHEDDKDKIKACVFREFLGFLIEIDDWKETHTLDNASYSCHIQHNGKIVSRGLPIAQCCTSYEHIEFFEIEEASCHDVQYDDASRRIQYAFDTIWVFVEDMMNIIHVET